MQSNAMQQGIITLDKEDILCMQYAGMSAS